MAGIEQWSPKILVSQTGALRLAYDAFMIAQQAAKHSSATLEFYRKRLPRFLSFLEERGVTDPEQITATHCRAFIVTLQDAGLSDNYIHQHAQIVKTFCRFLEAEELASQNAFARVKMPKVAERIMPAFTPEDVKALLGACRTARDRAIVLCLLDSGARAQEFVSLTIGDVDIQTGATHIQRGKGAKGRVCFLGAKARRELIKYLRKRRGAKPPDPLWLAHRTGTPLTYWGLAQMLRKLGKRAGVEGCNAHTFRRTCALWSLRSGMSIYHVRAMLGHRDLTVLQRYLALVEEDLAEAHREHGAVDSML